MTRKGEQYPEYAEVLRELSEPGGLLYGWELNEQGNAAIVTTHKWRQLSQTLSAVYQCDGFVSDGTVTIASGGKVLLRCLSVGNYPDAINAAKIAEEITGIPCVPGVSSSARKLVKWLGGQQRPSPSDSGLMVDMEYGYHDCVPSLVDNATLYDVRHCYYSLFSRLPSLFVTHSPKFGVNFAATPPEVKAKWKDLLQLIKPHKALRNALYGVMMGPVTGNELSMYRKGRECTLYLQPGPFRAAGLLVTRTGWELCRQASEESGSIYSNTDCVITLGGKPKIWDKAGLTVEQKARGSTHVCMRGVYRCGEKSTEFYRGGSRERLYTPRREEPPELVYKQWLM